MVCTFLWGAGVGAVEVDGIASSSTTFPWLIGEASGVGSREDYGVEHTLVLGVELNSETIELKSEPTPSEQPVWSSTGAEK